MELWNFLVYLFDTYGVAINVDPWFFTGVVPHISFVPQSVIDGILGNAGFIFERGKEPCGLTEMRGGHLTEGYVFPYTVDRILLVEPGDRCQIKDIRFYLDHELRHVATWILEHSTVWIGHN